MALERGGEQGLEGLPNAECGSSVGPSEHRGAREGLPEAVRGGTGVEAACPGRSSARAGAWQQVLRVDHDARLCIAAVAGGPRSGGSRHSSMAR